MRRGSGGLDFFDKIASATGGLIVHTTSTSLGTILGSFVAVRTSNVNENTCMDVKFIVQIKYTIGMYKYYYNRSSKFTKNLDIYFVPQGDNYGGSPCRTIWV